RGPGHGQRRARGAGALPRPEGHPAGPPHRQSGPPRRQSRGVRLHAQRRRDGRDRQAQAAGRTRGQSATRSELGQLTMIPAVEAKGARIPLVGLGTWDLRGRTCARVVEQALRLGDRHIDTAEMYDNEREVGEGLRASGVPRNEVFVVTKVWPSHFAPRDLLRAAKDSLVRLRLSEVDLLLLHWPNPQIPLSDTLGA